MLIQAITDQNSSGYGFGDMGVLNDVRYML